MKTQTSILVDHLFDRYPKLTDNRQSILASFEILQACLAAGGKILICGNGGSAADSEHIVGELMKGFRMKRQIGEEDRSKLTDSYPDGTYLADHLQIGLPAISLLNFTSLNSAFSNDVAADMTFAQGVYGLGRPGDALIGITTSGNSVNVINAVKVASVKGLRTVGLTGMQGGTLKNLCDACICVPESETYLVQEYHLPVYHTLCAMLEEEFFGC